jgi:prolyl oligopeptidase PreP (S9A serine peptidase family)
MIDLVDVQKLIYDRMSQLPYQVVDDYVLYQEVKPPFVQLGQLVIRDNDTKNTEGLVVEQYVNAISTYQGKKEILEMVQEVSELMKELEYEGYSIFIEEDDRTIIMDTDDNGNKFYHAVLIFRLNIY